MPMIDLPARREAEFKKLMCNFLALIEGKNYCEITHGLSKSAECPYDFSFKVKYWVVITGPNDLATEMRDLVDNCPNFRLISFEQHQGSYHWASDTYFKDCSAVEFFIE